MAIFFLKSLYTTCKSTIETIFNNVSYKMWNCFIIKQVGTKDTKYGGDIFSSEAYTTRKSTNETI